MMTSYSRTFRILVITALVASISLLHYAADLGRVYEHSFYRELYFLPIILAGFWFGLKGGLATSLTVTALYLPFVFIQQVGFSLTKFDACMEVLLFNIVAATLGFLRERELKHRGRLRQAETLAAMGQALSSVAHDMKTPLISIGGYTNFVRNKLVDSDPNRHHLKVVLRQAQRLEAMVKKMLDFSRSLQLDKSPTNLRQLLQEVVEVVKKEASNRDVDLEIVHTDGLQPVNVDPMRLEQALLNLVINAVQASTRGEAVTLRTIHYDGGVAIEVSDRGEGIPEETRSQILAPFFTTKKDGVGLGLPIANRIVEAHSGELEILDNPDRGVTFRIVLPYD
jgi:signal transduction histidine kinase